MNSTTFRVKKFKEVANVGLDASINRWMNENRGLEIYGVQFVNDKDGVIVAFVTYLER